MNRIDAAAVAKMVREVLKQKFAGVKFSVKTAKYSGGSSITVKWVDGPTKKQVEKEVGNMHGAEFDGMQDLKEYNGSPFGNDYIFCERNYSIGFLTAQAQRIAKEWGRACPKVEDGMCGAYINGDGESTMADGSWNYHAMMRQVIYRELQEVAA